MDRRQQAQRTRLLRPAAQHNAAGLGDQVIDSGYAQVGGEERLALPAFGQGFRVDDLEPRQAHVVGEAQAIQKGFAPSSTRLTARSRASASTLATAAGPSGTT